MTAPRDPAPPYDGPPPPTGEAASRPTRGDPADVLDRLGHSWTRILVSALVTLVSGILILVWPDETLHVLAVLTGLYLLATGAFRFMSVFSHRESGERFAGLLVAVLYVLAGVLCLRNPLQTIAALSLIVGTLWLVSGLLTLYTAIIGKDLPHRGVLLAVAVLGIVAGIVVLALPTESARALTRLLGLWLVLLGLAETALAFAWRAGIRRSAPQSPSGPGTETWTGTSTGT